MVRKNAISFICCTLLFSVPVFEQSGSAADVETIGDLKVSGVVDNSGGDGIRFPDGIIQTNACNACVSGVLPISLGGTGGATAAAARANLAVPGLSTANNFTASPQTILIGVPTFVGLAVQGASGQTANLQEWRNNSGAAVVSVGSGGDLTSTGNLALPATTTTTGIIRSGGVTLIHSYGSNNFFAGSFAGNLTMTGNSNTGTGVGALYSIADGTGNTATGNAALYFNTSGHYNTANGHAALDRNTSGYGNTGLGYAALFSNTIGHDNTASGYNALSSNTTAGSNTAVGSLALNSQSFSNSQHRLGLPTIPLWASWHSTVISRPQYTMED